jgi:purine nucleosidase
LAQEAAFSLEVHGTDGLGGYRHLLPPARPAAEPSGPQALLEASRRHAGALTVLATGPLTNLALALLEDAGLPARVARVVVMGGAFATAGNVTPVAEANFWHDPEAADLVLSAPWPVVAVGLDVTRRVWFGEAELDRLAGAANPAVRHLAAMARAYAEGYGQREGEVRCLLHDPLAALAVVEPEILSGGRAPVRVERRGEHTRGMSVADLRPGAGEPEHGPWLAWGVKAEAARGRLLEGLLGL